MRIGVEGSTSKGLSLNSQQNISLERNDVSNLPARLLVYDGAQRVDGLDLYTSDRAHVFKSRLTTAAEPSLLTDLSGQVGVGGDPNVAFVSRAAKRRACSCGEPQGNESQLLRVRNLRTRSRSSCLDASDCCCCYGCCGCTTSRCLSQRTALDDPRSKRLERQGAQRSIECGRDPSQIPPVHIAHSDIGWDLR